MEQRIDFWLLMAVVAAILHIIKRLLELIKEILSKGVSKPRFLWLVRC